MSDFEDVFGAGADASDIIDSYANEYYPNPPEGYDEFGDRIEPKHKQGKEEFKFSEFKKARIFASEVMSIYGLKSNTVRLEFEEGFGVYICRRELGDLHPPSDSSPHYLDHVNKFSTTKGIVEQLFNRMYGWGEPPHISPIRTSIVLK